MVSSRWSDGMRKDGGGQFLDMDPDAFQEIVSFLRKRRIDSTARSSFSAGAVDLALYLGIPVDHIQGSRHREVVFHRVGTKCGWGLAFSATLPHPSCGLIHALEFELACRTKCTVYTKEGGYGDS